VADFEAASLAGDELDHVEAAPPIEPIPSREPGRRRADEPPPFGRRDEFGGGCDRPARAGLHLDENDDLTVEGHQVHFPLPDSIAAGEDPKSGPAEHPFGELLARSTEPVAGIPIHEFSSRRLDAK